MERNKLSDEQLADLVMQLNGEINPIGETTIDSIRFNNLIQLQNIMELLMGEIIEVCKYCDRQEYSMSKAGKQALNWITDTQIRLIDTISDRIGDNQNETNN